MQLKNVIFMLAASANIGVYASSSATSNTASSSSSLQAIDAYQPEEDFSKFAERIAEENSDVYIEGAVSTLTPIMNRYPSASLVRAAIAYHLKDTYPHNYKSFPRESHPAYLNAMNNAISKTFKQKEDEQTNVVDYTEIEAVQDLYRRPVLTQIFGAQASHTSKKQLIAALAVGIGIGAVAAKIFGSKNQ